MQNILSFLMLSAACVGCLGQGSTTHVKWVPSAPGNTCRNQCRAVGSAVNMDMFENDKSGHALCGRIIGKELLLGEQTAVRFAIARFVHLSRSALRASFRSL